MRGYFSVRFLNVSVTFGTHYTTNFVVMRASLVQYFLLEYMRRIIIIALQLF